jgi:hypothetical protein
MKYASTAIIKGLERVVVLLPLEAVPLFDPENPPQECTYGVPDEVQVGWVKDGDDIFIPPPPPTIEEITEQYTEAVQDRLDAFARTRGYDGIMSACTYANSKTTQFQVEGEYCLDVRDATWAKCYQVMGAVLAGEQDMPTLEELFETLPKLEWPESEA